MEPVGRGRFVFFLNLFEIVHLDSVKMGLWQRWLKHPQRLSLRKAFLQVHLWAGVGLSLYILLMSVSGTVLIYRVELDRAFSRQPVIVAGSAIRMTGKALEEAAQRTYPDYQVNSVIEGRKPSQPAEVLLKRNGKRLRKLFNPYTGADLGNSLRTGFFVVEWIGDLHDNLLYQPVGRFINGIGGLIVTLLCLTGAVIWWPGIDSWRRSLTVSWKAAPKRFNWTLHSAFGFWSIAFIFMWGISGVYLALPQPFEAAVNFFQPVGKPSRHVPFGDQVLFWLTRLHIGRFGGLPMKLVWTVFGLAPVVLAITGILIWWNSVLGPKMRRTQAVQAQINNTESPHPGGSQVPANSIGVR
jgi:uncharacterized iron-regulated membrane protein